MNYALKEIFTGNRAFYFFLVFFSIGALAFLDMWTGVIRIFGIHLFPLFLGLTLVSIVSFLVYLYVTFKKKEKRERQQQIEAAEFEARRSQELAQILSQNPIFVTHCYECQRFNLDLKLCSRKIPDKSSVVNVKEIKINDKPYCLYWIAATATKEPNKNIADQNPLG